MARYRTIKPELFPDESLVEVSIEVRFLFIGLLPFVDDMGRRQYSPKRIKMEVFPGDEKISWQQVDGWMRELDKTRVIRIYEVDGVRFFWLPHFLRHQKIDRPSHSYCPPHPEDRKPDCQCISCKAKRNGANVPSFTRRPLDEDSVNRRGLDEHSAQEVGSVVECNVGEGGEEPPPEPSHHQTQTPNPHSDRSGEDRRTLSAGLDALARRILDVLGIPSNSQILQAVTESLRVKAKADGCSIEVAANKIAGRAAIVKRESPPESWLFWFRDARYDYVPRGDKRLNQRAFVVRPTCGGAQCSEGWESVTVNGERRLRRCAACVQLWKDQGIEA